MSLLFSFPSYHFAKKTEQLLQEEQIPCQLRPMPPKIHPSCGLCVVVARADKDRVCQLLMAHQITHGGIYELCDE